MSIVLFLLKPIQKKIYQDSLLFCESARKQKMSPMKLNHEHMHIRRGELSSLTLLATNVQHILSYSRAVLRAQDFLLFDDLQIDDLILLQIVADE